MGLCVVGINILQPQLVYHYESDDTGETIL